MRPRPRPRHQHPSQSHGRSHNPPSGLPSPNDIEHVFREADRFLEHGHDRLFVTVYAAGLDGRFEHKITADAAYVAPHKNSRYNHYPYYATIAYMQGNSRDAAHRIAKALSEQLVDQERHLYHQDLGDRLRHLRQNNPHKLAHRGRH